MLNCDEYSVDIKREKSKCNFFSLDFGTLFENPMVVNENFCVLSASLCKRQLLLFIHKLMCLLLMELKALMLNKVVLKRQPLSHLYPVMKL